MHDRVRLTVFFASLLVLTGFSAAASFDSTGEGCYRFNETSSPSDNYCGSIDAAWSGTLSLVTGISKDQGDWGDFEGRGRGPVSWRRAWDYLSKLEDYDLIEASGSTNSKRYDVVDPGLEAPVEFNPQEATEPDLQ